MSPVLVRQSHNRDETSACRPDIVRRRSATPLLAARQRLGRGRNLLGRAEPPSAAGDRAIQLYLCEARGRGRLQQRRSGDHHEGH